jgi:glycosyltransferase involved in cell wall biosynthesis
MTASSSASGDGIVVVIPSLKSGGTQRVVCAVMQEWARRGRHVHLLTLEGPESDFFQPPQRVRRTTVGMTWGTKGQLAAHASNLVALFRIRKSLRASPPKAVLSVLTATNILVIIASLGLGLRVVVSERNDPTRQKAGLWGPLRRLLYRRATVVTANTDHAVEAMTAYVPKHKLAMVPNPVALNVTLTEPASARTILNVGRLVPAKGQGAIIAAFSSLAHINPDWRLCILGDGPLRDALGRDIETNGLADRVSLPGNVSNPGDYYATAAIFVLASAYEGVPNTLLEAMAHGLPCIVPDSLPGALQYVEDGVSGLVYRFGDNSDLARSLSLLMGDPELRIRLGGEARQRIQVLSTENVVRLWDEILKLPPATNS